LTRIDESFIVPAATRQKTSAPSANAFNIDPPLAAAASAAFRGPGVGSAFFFWDSGAGRRRGGGLERSPPRASSSSSFASPAASMGTDVRARVRVGFRAPPRSCGDDERDVHRRDESGVDARFAGLRAAGGARGVVAPCASAGDAIGARL
jgi:hypothetical protein